MERDHSTGRESGWHHKPHSAVVFAAADTELEKGIMDLLDEAGVGVSAVLLGSRPRNVIEGILKQGAQGTPMVIPWGLLGFRTPSDLLTSIRHLLPEHPTLLVARLAMPAAMLRAIAAQSPTLPLGNIHATTLQLMRYSEERLIVSRHLTSAARRALSVAGADGSVRR